MRARLLAAGLCIAAVALGLAGCGSQGYAPTLGPTLHATLTAQHTSHSAGTAVLTPFYATHIVTYYPSSTAVPYNGAHTPVLLRNGSCIGPTLAALTNNAVGAAPSSSHSAGNADPALATVRPATDGGVDVAVAQSANDWVAVFDRPYDANATMLACGQPLSGRSQYFDLYPPAVGSSGTGKGIVLMQPIVAAHLAVTLAAAPPATATWSLRSGGCSGATLASGQIAAGQTHAAGDLFAAPSSGGWWLTVAASGQALCGALAK